MSKIKFNDILIRSTITHGDNRIVQEIEGVQYGTVAYTLGRYTCRSRRVVDTKDKNNFKTVSCKKSMRLTYDFTESLDNLYKCFVDKTTRNLLLTLQRKGGIQDYIDEVKRGIDDIKVVETSPYYDFQFENDPGICISYYEAPGIDKNFDDILARFYDTFSGCDESIKLRVVLHFPCTKYFNRKDCEVYAEILRSFSNSFACNLKKAKRIALFA